MPGLTRVAFRNPHPPVQKISIRSAGWDPGWDPPCKRTEVRHGKAAHSAREGPLVERVGAHSSSSFPCSSFVRPKPRISQREAFSTPIRAALGRRFSTPRRIAGNERAGTTSPGRGLGLCAAHQPFDSYRWAPRCLSISPPFLVHPSLASGATDTTSAPAIPLDVGAWEARCFCSRVGSFFEFWAAEPLAAGGETAGAESADRSSARLSLFQ